MAKFYKICKIYGGLRRFLVLRFAGQFLHFCLNSSNAVQTVFRNNSQKYEYLIKHDPNNPYLGGVRNDKRSEELDAAFKQEKSNFHIAIVVDMWITGFDVPSLTYLYNDKPLKKHLLIQTISRVNRKYPGKEYGMIIDYIGIRDNMREAMKIYGGDTSVAPTVDDVEQATNVFREELEILKNLFVDYDLTLFFNIDCDPIERYKLLAKAAEFVFISTQELKIEGSRYPKCQIF